MGDKTKTPGIMTNDGWQNLITGLNSVRTAKKRHTRHTFDGLLADVELDSLYAEDGLATRIVKLLPDDIYREGWEYDFPAMDKLKSAQFAEVYSAILEEISAQSKLEEAAYWNRLKGGSAILISVIDGLDMSQPLNPKKIRTFEKLKVFDRTEIEFSNIQWQENRMQIHYGLPLSTN